MGSLRKRYPIELKVKIVLAILKKEKSVTQLASEHQIHHSQLLKWKKQVLEGLPKVFGDPRTEALKPTHEKEVMALYQEIGQLTTQLAWLKKSPGSPEPCTTQRVGRARLSGVSPLQTGLPSGSVPIRTLLPAGLSLNRGGGSSAPDRRDRYPLAIPRESPHGGRSQTGGLPCGKSPRPDRPAGDGNRGDPSRAHQPE